MTLRQEEEMAERKRQEALKQQEIDRMAAAGVFQDIDGTTQAELDAQAAEAAEEMKALGSEREAATMLMKHLQSGKAPVIHERYYPNLMHGISKLPSGGAGQGAPSQRSSTATAGQNFTAGEGFGGLPVLPGRPGIPGVALPEGFHEKLDGVSERRAESSMRRGQYPSPMSPFLQQRIHELNSTPEAKSTAGRSPAKKRKTKKGTARNSKSSRKKGVSIAASPATLSSSHAGGILQSGTSSSPKRAKSMFPVKQKVGFAVSSPIGNSIADDDWGDIQHIAHGSLEGESDAIGGVDADHVHSAPRSPGQGHGRRMIRGIGSAPSLASSQPLPRGKSAIALNPRALVKSPTKRIAAVRSDQAMDDADDRWALEMWTFSPAAYKAAAEAIRRSNGVDTSRKRIILRWIVQAAVSSGLQSDVPLKGLEKLLMEPVRLHYQQIRSGDIHSSVVDRAEASRQGFSQLASGNISLLGTGEAVALETAIRHATAEDMRSRLSSHALFALSYKPKPNAKMLHKLKHSKESKQQGSLAAIPSFHRTAPSGLGEHSRTMSRLFALRQSPSGRGMHPSSESDRKPSVRFQEASAEDSKEAVSKSQPPQDADVATKPVSSAQKSPE